MTRRAHFRRPASARHTTSGGYRQSAAFGILVQFGIEAGVGWEVHGGVQRARDVTGSMGLPVNMVALAFVGGCCR
jgi:hypothetical protein